MQSYSATIHVMIKAARKAARPLVRDFGELEQLQTSRKAQGGFLNRAFERMEYTISTALLEARPEYGLLTQAAGERKGKESCYSWVVQPLDGGDNFIHALPWFGTSIALQKHLPNGNQEIIAAVIFLPILQEVFWAEKGKGAWLESDRDHGGRAKRLRISGCQNIANALCAIGPLHTHTGVAKDLHAEGATIRQVGCTAMALAYVAAGSINGFLCKASTFPAIAAGSLLVQEAGGYLCDNQGKPANTAGDIVATNEALRAALTKILTKTP